ncbi:MAG: hypothetical protein JXQ97_03730 [Natronospirillum sp.]
MKARLLFMIYAAVGFILALLFLSRLPVTTMTELALGVTVAVMSWITYQYFDLFWMVRRHAFMSYVFKDKSRWKTRFWGGLIPRTLLALTSIISAIVALVLTAQMSLVEWLVIFGMTPVFLLLHRYVRTAVRKEVNPRYRFGASLKVAYWLTLLVSVVVLVVIQFNFTDVPDTRHLTLMAIAQETFESSRTEAVLPLIGIVYAVGQTASSVAWHLMQVASSAESFSLGMKLLGWIIFLFLNSLKIGSVWLFLLGVAVLAGKLQEKGIKALGETTFSRSHNITILVIFFIFIAISKINVGGLVSSYNEAVIFHHTSSNNFLTEFTCRDERRSAQNESFLAESNARLSEERERLIATMENKVDEQVDSLFSSAETGVDSFLDWNFSLRGQYQQLGFMGAQYVSSSSLEGLIESKLQETIGVHFSNAAMTVDQELSDHFLKSLSSFYSRHTEFLDELERNGDCATVNPPSVNLEQWVDLQWRGAGSGAPIAIVGRQVASRIGARVASTMVAKMVSRVVVNTLARLSVKVVTTGTAGAAGAVCGPGAPVCGAAAAGATWLATDFAIIWADDKINREPLKAEMLEIMDAEKEQFKKEVMDAYIDQIDFFVGVVEAYQYRRFNIRRDGL